MTERLTVDDLRAAIAQIEATCNDDEHAHILEDGLHQAVLEAIALGTCDDPAECAALALQTRDISFYRWYA